MQSFGVVGFISEIQCISGEVLKRGVLSWEVLLLSKVFRRQVEYWKMKILWYSKNDNRKSKDHGNSCILTLLLSTYISQLFININLNLSDLISSNGTRKSKLQK